MNRNLHQVSITRRYMITLLLAAFAIGLLPSVLIFASASRRADDLENLFTLISSANVGNLRNDIIKKLGSPEQELSASDSLLVKGYSPKPTLKISDAVSLYKRGRYLLYIYYDKNDIVQATYVAEKTR